MGVVIENEQLFVNSCNNIIFTLKSLNKMKYLVLLLVIYSSNLCFAQSHSFLLKKLEKKKYTKVEKTINKGLEKHSSDLILLDIKARLYLSSEFKKYNPEISYTTVLSSISLLSSVTHTTAHTKRLEKAKINTKSRTLFVDSIAIIAYGDAKKTDQVSDYNHFLGFYTKIPLSITTLVIQSRNTAAFRDARTTNTVESFQLYMDTYPSSEHFYDAIKLRNTLAFEEAKKINTIVSFQYFIDTYPIADEKNEAIRLRDILAFNEAKSSNTIISYQYFIDNYPDAVQKNEAVKIRDQFAYDEAKRINTSESYSYFIKKYPQSKQYQQAFGLFELKQFEENTTIADWRSYSIFINKYANNSMVDNAMDSIIYIGVTTDNIEALKYGADYFTGQKKAKSLQKYYELYTADGDPESLQNFHKFYYLPSVLEKDKEIAERAKNLLLHLPFNKKLEKNYAEFIGLAAPRELAFVAIQRLISPHLEKKEWAEASNIINRYKHLFQSDSAKIKNLLSLIEAPYQKDIRKRSVGRGINTSDGSEYAPTVTEKGDLLYFCGTNRRGNVGGEDIFVSKKSSKGYWGTDKLVAGLSSARTNDAPLNIAENGTKMLLFQSGKIYFSEKTANSWTAIEAMPTIINSAEWQADAMIASDGKTLIFAATRKDALNTNSIYSKKYHGDDLLPTDLYIAQLDNNNNWSEPQNLGKTLNTRYCERTPFLHADMKTLYFSSDGHGGLGKLDVFKSVRLADSCWNCWSKPINLGKDFNGTESDLGYKITKEGDKAYFTNEKKSTEKSSILFLLDISGSMDGNKIETLKEVANSIISDVVDKNAEVGILAFNGDCDYPISKVLNFTQHSDSTEYFINQLYAGGGTPMYSAYYYASAFMKKNADPKTRKKTIVLMTDGDANKCFKLNDMYGKIRKSRIRYKTQTIAYNVTKGSAAYNDLRSIAKFSYGEFFYAEKPQDLGQAFDNASQHLIGLNSLGSSKDIQYVNLPKHLRPDFVAEISGELRNSKNEPIAATIKWEDLETGEVIGQSKSDPIDGSYFIILPLGKHYGYYIDKSVYFPISNNIDLSSQDKAIAMEEKINLVTFKEMIDEGIAVPINNLFFDFSKYDLLPNSKTELARVAKIILDKNVVVEIRGHTDDIGTEKENQILSENRANSVMKFLINQGCDSNKLSTVGYGESKPIISNSTDKGRAKNRRVELIFKY